MPIHIRTLIEKRREHSRKPDCVHERIERLVAGPYLELFARASRPGWTTWGNERTKFDADGLNYRPSLESRQGETVAGAWDDMWAKPFDYAAMESSG